MSSITKSEIDLTFGRILKDFRRKKRFTQEELAEKLGISLKYISRIENGYSGIKHSTLINYMNLLDITPNTIFDEFITNEKTREKMELSSQINSLSDNDFKLISSIIELLISRSKSK